MKNTNAPAAMYTIPSWAIPDNGVAPAPLGRCSEDWACPVCGLGKDAFNEAKIFSQRAKRHFFEFFLV